MKHKILLTIISTAFVLLMGNFAVVSACTCLSVSTCEMYEKADAIFVGKVIDSTKKTTVKEQIYNESETSDETRKATYATGDLSIEVLEAFKGAKINEPIKFKAGLTSCSFRFKLDETYLIYAYKRDDGSYVTNICTPTRSLSEAKEDLVFLKNPPKTGDGTNIFGTVYESVNDHSEENLTVKPFEKVNVLIESTTDKKRKFTATTDFKGEYQITVPPDTYTVKPIVPAYFTTESLDDNEDKELVVAKDTLCVNKIFRIKNDSEITGKVLDVNGKPVKDITVKLFLENTEQSNIARGEWATTDEKGIFSFKYISLGRYFLAVNFDDAPEDKTPYPTVFYPNVKDQSQTQIFEINNGTKHNKIIFLLPAKLKKQKLEGQVVFKDGKPAGKVEVNLYDEQFDSTDHFKKIETDENGNFSLEGFEGRKYSVQAIVWKQISEDRKHGSAQGESEVFVLDVNTPKIKIVLEELPDLNIPTEDTEDEESETNPL